MKDFFILTITFVTGVLATHFYYIFKYIELYEKSSRTEFFIVVTKTAFLKALPFLLLIVVTMIVFFILRNTWINKDRDKIISEAEAEAKKIIETNKRHERYLVEVAEQRKKEFAREKQRLFAEYKRKNDEKNTELEALRKQVKRLKKNQYDPRKAKQH